VSPCAGCKRFLNCHIPRIYSAHTHFVIILRRPNDDLLAFMHAGAELRCSSAKNVGMPREVLSQVASHTSAEAFVAAGLPRCSSALKSVCVNPPSPQSNNTPH
jgi:hypothetical protein